MGYIHWKDERGPNKSNWQRHQEESRKSNWFYLRRIRDVKKEIEEVKWIALEMKASSQTKLLTHTPITMARTIEEVTVAKTNVQALTVSYAEVVQ